MVPDQLVGKLAADFSMLHRGLRYSYRLAGR